MYIRVTAQIYNSFKVCEEKTLFLESNLVPSIP